MQLERILKTQSKKDILKWTVLVTVISVLISILLTVAIVLGINPSFLNWRYIAPALIVPLLVAPPVSYLGFGIVHKLEIANQKLETTNQKLKDANENLKTANHKLEHVSKHDDLTGLYNRSYFWQEAKTMLARAKTENTSVAVILLDVDNFKNINDIYGHQIGDKVLQHIAKTIEKCTRHGDLVGRYGGEEFSIIFNNCQIDNARERAQAICTVVGKTTFETDGIGLPISVSVGVATNKQDDNFEVLINLADTAMYQAKNQGKNQVCFSHLLADDSSKLSSDEELLYKSQTI